MYYHSHLAIEAQERNQEAMRDRHPDEAYQPIKYSSVAVQSQVRAACPDNARNLFNAYRLRLYRIKGLLFHCYELRDADTAERVRERMVMRHKQYDARLSQFINSNK
jgi:hypothetical protein